PLFKLVSDVRKNGSSWSLPPTTRSENQGWQSSFYCIWQERNSRLHRCLSCPASMVAAKIISLCVDKCSYMSTLGSSLGPHLCGYLVPQSIVRGIQ
ncbi:unnamed protein product, partial [Brassica oleracea]